MTKKELRQYRALQLEILDLQRRISEIESTSRNTSTTDKVKGSSKVFPYVMRSFTIEGIGEDEEEHKKKLQLKQVLQNKRKELLEATNKIEEYIDGIQDSETRLIFRLHFLDGMPQESISKKIHLAQSKVSERIKEQLRENVSKEKKTG